MYLLRPFPRELHRGGRLPEGNYGSCSKCGVRAVVA